MTDIDRNEIEKIIKITVPVMLFFFAMLLLLLIHNTFRFIFFGKQLRSFQVCYFYCLVGLAVGLRSVCMSLQLSTAYSSNIGIDRARAVQITDYLATYAELVVGVQQASSMTELYFQLQNILLVYTYRGRVLLQEMNTVDSQTERSQLYKSVKQAAKVKKMQIINLRIILVFLTVILICVFAVLIMYYKKTQLYQDLMIAFFSAVATWQCIMMTLLYCLIH